MTAPACRNPKCARRQKQMNWVFWCVAVSGVGVAVRWLGVHAGHHPLAAAAGGLVSAVGSLAVMAAITVAMITEWWVNQ